MERLSNILATIYGRNSIYNIIASQANLKLQNNFIESVYYKNGMISLRPAKTL